MTSRIYTILFLALSFNSIGQIKELKTARDKARNLLNLSSDSKTLNVTNNYVNPFIGTGGHGHTYPGASAPFGMIQLSPDTRHDGWDGCSGYHYSDSIIYGFSHTHLSGTGVSDYGDLLIVPQVGKAKTDPGYYEKNGYGDRFDHATEEAKPGYYKVHLENNNIDVELTVSERAGFHSYTFNNPKGKKFLLLDLDHRDKLLDHSFNIIDNKTISGSRVSSAWATEQHFYFHLELENPYDKIQIIEKNGKHKALLTFSKDTESIKIRVGISSVSTAGAKANLIAEMPTWNFELYKANIARKWNKELNKVYFQSDDPEVMTNFYTGLYHSFLAPNLFSDVDGNYRGRDNKIHKLEPLAGKQYTVFSLWDTYRGTHPLFTLTQVKRTNDFVNTFLRQFEQGGDLPVWELAGNETECMIGYHSVSVIADAFVKGIRDFDAKAALKAMVATANFDEFGKKEFQEMGYINAGNEPESVSKSLEYSYDEFCISQMIQAVQTDREGNTALGPAYKNTMYNFVNTFDPQTGFMRARRNGMWFSPFDPAEVNFNYTEANSWQYSLYAPHAVGILTELLGGPDSLEAWLDRLFTTEAHLSGRHQVDITGLIGQYAHGNEPSHHMAYLYNYTNSPEKTQYYVDRILKEMYSNTPDGLSGNEDCGQMSSWYVLSALGFYQIAPGNPYYEIGRPLMNKALIRFENGKRLRIVVENNSPENKYVSELIFNGFRLNRSYLSHEELSSGGQLLIRMSKTPPSYDKDFRHAPTLTDLPKTFIPLPYFEQEEHVFVDSMEVSLDVVPLNNCEIHYTTDGTEPTINSPKYSEPFYISNSTEIKAFAANSLNKSAVVKNTFVKKDVGISIELKSTYANQYAGGGEFALIDGIHGSKEFRTGDWQGFWDQDFEAIISFNAPRSIKEIGIGVLSDMKSWIFQPSSVSFIVSYDGETWDDKVITTNLDLEEQKDMYPHRKDVTVTVDASRPIQKIKVIATARKECPEWHLGNGNPTWIFIDEVYFK